MSSNPYRFRLDRSLDREAVRLFRGQINRARRSLKTPSDTTVHTARKAIKRARAVLRLVRGALPCEQARDLDHALRAVGRRLGPVRDAAVAQSLTDVLQDKGVLKKAAARHLSAVLHTVRVSAWEVLEADGGIDGVRADLGSLRLTHGELAGLHTLSLHDGLAGTYARGRERLAQAVETPSTTALHAWRRQAKHLGYQIRLVTPAWPLVLGSTARAFDALTDALGDDHDLAEWVRVARNAGLAPKALRAAERHAQTRREALQMAAWPLGARLYAEEPASFAGRLTVYLATGLAEANHAPVHPLDGVALPAPPDRPLASAPTLS